MQSVSPILDHEQLRAFAAFADSLSFTRAARVVGLSQPALFERVQRLAAALDTRLYQRDGKALELTEAGVRVAAFARDLLAQTSAFVGELRGVLPREAVTLAAGEGAFLYLLGPAIARFAADDAASLRLLTYGARAASEAVLSGEADLAVAVLDLVPDGLTAHDLVRTPLCAAMSARHPLAKQRRVTLAQLSQERLVLPPPGRSHRDFVGRAIARLGHELSPPIEADGWPLVLKFAALGLGVAVINGICELPEGVVTRPIPELGTVTYRLLRRRGNELGAAANRLSRGILGLDASSAPASRKARG
jgi:DNA-binding transcriptional LysR family regulator